MSRGGQGKWRETGLQEGPKPRFETSPLPLSEPSPAAVCRRGQWGRGGDSPPRTSPQGQREQGSVGSVGIFRPL